MKIQTILATAVAAFAFSGTVAPVMAAKVVARSTVPVVVPPPVIVPRTVPSKC